MHSHQKMKVITNLTEICVPGSKYVCQTNSSSHQDWFKFPNNLQLTKIWLNIKYQVIKYKLKNKDKWNWPKAIYHIWKIRTNETDLWLSILFEVTICNLFHINLYLWVCNSSRNSYIPNIKSISRRLQKKSPTT